jgi:hypothetical protein
MNPVSSDWVLPLLALLFFTPHLKTTATSNAVTVRLAVFKLGAVQCIALDLILVAFQKNFSCGTHAAL